MAGVINSPAPGRLSEMTPEAESLRILDIVATTIEKSTKEFLSAG
jgi:hypothetical protein